MSNVVAARMTAARALGTGVQTAGTVGEVLAASGLDYTVGSVPMDHLEVLTEEGTLSTGVSGRRLLHRTDTGEGYGVVSGRYALVQNPAAFAVGDDLFAGGARFEAAGESRPGRPFVTMLLPDATASVSALDSVQIRIVLTADHTGSASVSARIAAERLVCTNGMTVDLPGTVTETAIRHTGDASERLRVARTMMREAHRYAKTFQAVASELIDTPMSHPEFVAWIDGVFPRPTDQTGSKVTRWERRRAGLLNLFASADTQEEGRGTRWAAFNAVTEWQTWAQPTRGDNQSRARRNLADLARTDRERALSTLLA